MKNETVLVQAGKTAIVELALTLGPPATISSGVTNSGVAGGRSLSLMAHQRHLSRALQSQA